MDKISQLGQVFTPPSVVCRMLQLRKKYGKVLEPASGDNIFVNSIPGCVGIEIDPVCNRGRSLNIDFFDYSLDNKFDTIIGNPPYVRYRDILTSTKKKLNSSIFDSRSNLYLFFIEKCIKHLKDSGELIFITPRDFLKATSSIKLNKFIFENGTITDVVDLGDRKIFNGFSPNCIIWRFEKNDFSRKTNSSKNFVFYNGQLLFTENVYPVKFSDIFYVKVGAVSGNNEVFINSKYGNLDFVYSGTCKTGKTVKVIFNKKIKYLDKYKNILLQRRIKEFDESNWWTWGRSHYLTKKKRIYVNCKTRNAKPFFIHKCINYDGSVLAIFPHNQKLDLRELCENMNEINWNELGFICDGRYLFSQKSMENSLLPGNFNKYIDWRN
ncbi:MAG: class I SAM-dependent methyltransferase [Elusimicrobia bacterium]|nr:class I SAM-dependent methyltransferase [Elusimicrobiota bacterium]